MSGYQDVPMTRRRAQLLEEYASKLADMLEAAPNDKDLAEWVQSKIDRAAAAIQSAYHYLDQDDESDLEKAVGHKYTHRKLVGRDPKTNRARYRYYYAEHQGGGISRAKFEAGSAFKLTWRGRRGHFHIDRVEGDQIFITHDSRPNMEPVPVQADELRALLRKQHSKAEQKHVEKRRRQVEEIKRRAHRGGLGLALHRLRQAAAQAGVSLPEQYQRKPKKTRAKVAETAREVETPRDQLTSTAQQIIEDANQEHAERHDEHQEITRFELGEHTHTKTGAKLYTAKQTERVERDEYFRRLEIAKRHGGRYERRYVRGFVFKTAEDARAFALEVEGAAPPETSAETVTPHDEHPGADNFETMPEVESARATTATVRDVQSTLKASRRADKLTSTGRRARASINADKELIEAAQRALDEGYKGMESPAFIPLNERTPRQANYQRLKGALNGFKSSQTLTRGSWTDDHKSLQKKRIKARDQLDEALKELDQIARSQEQAQVSIEDLPPKGQRTLEDAKRFFGEPRYFERIEGSKTKRYVIYERDGHRIVGPASGRGKGQFSRSFSWDTPRYRREIEQGNIVQSFSDLTYEQIGDYDTLDEALTRTINQYRSQDEMIDKLIEKERERLAQGREELERLSATPREQLTETVERVTSDQTAEQATTRATPRPSEATLRGSGELDETVRANLQDRAQFLLSTPENVTKTGMRSKAQKARDGELLLIHRRLQSDAQERLGPTAPRFADYSQLIGMPRADQPENAETRAQFRTALKDAIRELEQATSGRAKSAVSTQMPISEDGRAVERLLEAYDAAKGKGDARTKRALRGLSDQEFDAVARAYEDHSEREHLVNKRFSGELFQIARATSQLDFKISNASSAEKRALRQERKALAEREAAIKTQRQQELDAGDSAFKNAPFNITEPMINDERFRRQERAENKRQREQAKAEQKRREERTKAPHTDTQLEGTARQRLLARARRVQKSARPLITYRAQLIQTVERLTAA